MNTEKTRVRLIVFLNRALVHFLIVVINVAVLLFYLPFLKFKSYVFIGGEPFGFGGVTISQCFGLPV